MYSGYPNDINNTISIYDVYNPGGTVIPGNVGVPVGNNGALMGNQNPAGVAAAAGNGKAAAVRSSGGFLGQSVMWWFILLAVGIVMVVLARRGAGEDRFSNIRGSLYNLTFLAMWYIIIKNVLNVIASNFSMFGLSKLILAA